MAGEYETAFLPEFFRGGGTGMAEALVQGPLMAEQYKQAQLANELAKWKIETEQVKPAHLRAMEALQQLREDNRANDLNHFKAWYANQVRQGLLTPDPEVLLSMGINPWSLIGPGQAPMNRATGQVGAAQPNKPMALPPGGTVYLPGSPSPPPPPAAPPPVLTIPSPLHNESSPQSLMGELASGQEVLASPTPTSGLLPMTTPTPSQAPREPVLDTSSAPPRSLQERLQAIKIPAQIPPIQHEPYQPIQVPGGTMIPTPPKPQSKSVEEQIRERELAGTTTDRDKAYRAMETKRKQEQAGAMAKGKAAAIDSRLSSEALDTMAEQYLAGDTSVLTNLGRGMQGAENIKALRERIATKANQRGLSGADLAATNAEFIGAKAGQRTLGTRAATLELAVVEAQQMAPLVLEASAKVSRTQVPLLNQAILAAQKGTGDPNVVRLGVALNSLINIYARAINPTGQITVSDKNHARELLDKAWATGQLEAGVDQLLLEMAQARTTPGIVKKELRGSITGKESTVPLHTSKSSSPYVETRTTPDGRKLGKKADGTIEVIP